MARKKKLIWWESEPAVHGAGEARARGSQDDPRHRGSSGSPYYGPVTVQRESDPDEDALGLVTG